MSSIYYYFIEDPTGIAAKVITLDNKISTDLDLPNTYVSTVYNAGTQTVEVTFSSSLTSFQINVLNNLTQLVLFNEPLTVTVYNYDSNAFNRRSFSVSGIPTANSDALSGYSPGSSVTTTSNDSYFCTNNTIGNAVWVKVSAGGPTPNCIEIFATSDTSTSSSSYGLLNSMTITPTAGTYLVIFTSIANIPSSNGRGSYVIYVGGNIDTSSERDFASGMSNGNARGTLVTQGKVTVNGSQTVEIRFKITSSTFRVYNRKLTLLSVS